MSRLIPKLDKFSAVFRQFEKDYDVGFCRTDEIDDALAFIDTYWKKGHVLVKSRRLLDWQHLDREHGRYNFAIARNKASGAIHALKGFIPASQFDPALEKLLVWGAIWKVRDDISAAGLGGILSEFITRSLPIDTWVSFNISEDAKKNDRQTGCSIGSASNYFFANPRLQDFKIAAGLEKFQTQAQHNTPGFSLRELDSAAFEALPDSAKPFACIRPYKSKTYLLNRYFRHPFYTYRCHTIVQGDAASTQLRAVFFTRESPANGRNCLRMVEYAGDYAELRHVRADMAGLLLAGNYEYIDIITSNVDDAVLQSAGFINKNTDPGIIIPNYFEPFVQENIPLEYSYISLDPHFKPVLNKGDADQDRPSAV